MRRSLFPAAWLTLVLCAAPLARGADRNGTIAERPFAPRGAPPAKTMFTLLPPETTGVRTENHYADPKMWGERYQEFLFGAIGSGVAIGDYDGDGRPDIFVVSKTESCRLFRNLGDFKFEDVTDKAGVGDAGAAAQIWKQGVTFVDINNDGLLDLYICRFNAPNLLYINQGNGTFKEMAHTYGLDIKDACGMASFGDYDRDGWLDVYIATNLLNNAEHPSGQRGYLLHNNRDGTFSNVTESAGISGETQSHSATWWDYDNDGWPDLYVANDYGVPDKLYHNNRDGTFTDSIDRVVPHTSFSSMGADTGDINNDGLIDLMVGDMAPTTHEKDQRTAADIRGKASEPPDGSNATRKQGRNALLLNTGTGRCLEVATLAGLAATDWTWALRFEDLDNDGRIDLYVSNGMNVEQNTDVNNRMMNAESPAERIRIMHASPALPEPHLAFRNLGDLAFENVSAAWGLDQKGISFGAAFGDLNGDGNLDLVYTNYQAGATVLRNDCATGHRIMVDLRGTLSNRFGIGATIRIETAAGIQVRQLWLARGYMSSSEPSAHFGLGDDTLIKKLTVTWPSGLTQNFTDLPVDRHFTITEPSVAAPPLQTAEPTAAEGQFTDITQSSGLATPTHEEALDETSVQRLLPFRLNRRGPSLAVADINGDGFDDVVIGGTTVTPARVLLGTAAGTFLAIDSSKVLPVGSVDDGPLLLFDANGDGRPDLLVTKGGNSFPAGSTEYQPLLYLNHGDGNFVRADDVLPPLSLSAGAAVCADFNQDGSLDLFIGGRVLPGQYPLSPHSALLANHGGKFEDVTDKIAPELRSVGMVTAALWSDVDGDGWLDLLVAVEWGKVRYFHNLKGVRFEDWTEKSGFASAGTGWWTSLAAADFNSDGRPDYVLGNAGLNTPYRATAEHPALLLVGEFKGDDSTQLIEAYDEGDRLYPRRSRKELGSVIPSLLKKYPRNDAYARATLDEILGPKKIAEAQRFAATELRSGVLLSQADGTYRFEPLPRLAQAAPFQGVVAGDFNGDGHADIYAAQNSYAPVAAIGRFDGGLSQLLLGDGRGNFAPVSPLESRLVVPGDAKALVVVDIDHDGWPDFIVSRNNDTPLSYRNRGVPGRRSVCLRLSDTSGHPAPPGTRVTVWRIDGTTELKEIYGGSGYYSQSSAAIFVGFSEANRSTRIRVRWPSGESFEQDIPPGPPVLEISPPKGAGPR